MCRHGKSVFLSSSFLIDRQTLKLKRIYKIGILNFTCKKSITFYKIQQMLACIIYLTQQKRFAIIIIFYSFFYLSYCLKYKLKFVNVCIVNKLILSVKYKPVFQISVMLSKVRLTDILKHDVAKNGCKQFTINCRYLVQLFKLKKMVKSIIYITIYFKHCYIYFRNLLTL